MKRFKTNMGVFSIFPFIISLFMLMYMLIIYTRSNFIVNIINIGMDGIILIYYFINFCYMVRYDSEWIIFYTPFKKHSMKPEELGFVVHASFMTKFVCKSGNFYMPTTAKGSMILKDMFKGKGRTEDKDKE